MTAENQRKNVRIAAEALAPVAASTSSSWATATARRSVCWRCRAPPTGRWNTYPLDVLGAQTEGMIGYMIEQELGNLLPFERPVRHDAHDGRGRSERSGVREPDQVHRPGLREGRSRPPRRREGMDFKQDGDKWRRVVPSPQPKRIFELRPVKWLLEHNTHRDLRRRRRHPDHVPARRRAPARRRRVRDRQGPRHRSSSRASSSADLSSCPPTPTRSISTGASRRRGRSGAPRRRRWRRCTFAAGSMGPKVEAACEFAAATGKSAAIGALADLGKIIAGKAGTTMSPKERGIVYADSHAKT